MYCCYTQVYEFRLPDAELVWGEAAGATDARLLLALEHRRTPGQLNEQRSMVRAHFCRAAVLDVHAQVRTRVVYGADGERWPKVMAALRKGDIADGDVHLIFERQLESDGSGSAQGSRA